MSTGTVNALKYINLDFEPDPKPIYQRREGAGLYKNYSNPKFEPETYTDALSHQENCTNNRSCELPSSSREFQKHQTTEEEI